MVGARVTMQGALQHGRNMILTALPDEERCSYTIVDTTRATNHCFVRYLGASATERLTLPMLLKSPPQHCCRALRQGLKRGLTFFGRDVSDWLSVGSSGEELPGNYPVIYPISVAL